MLEEIDVEDSPTERTLVKLILVQSFQQQDMATHSKVRKHRYHHCQ